MEQEELKAILEAHKLWLEGNVKGKKANLSGTNLRLVDLRLVDLRGADLSDANLRGANFRDADLNGAIMIDGWKLIRDE